jgi:glycosyltransferase involved in cell wall biosynthesis
VYDVFAGQKIPQAEARARLGLPGSGPILLFFGLVRPYKGLACLLDALALLNDLAEPPYLVVAGEFWQAKEAYQQQINRLGLARQVRLDNRYIPNEEVSLYFSAADLFVAPYTGGTQSGSLKLALGFGLPAVASRAIASDLDEYVDRGVTLVETGDAHSLAAGMRQALLRKAAPLPGSSQQEWQQVIDALLVLCAPDRPGHETIRERK